VTEAAALFAEHAAATGFDDLPAPLVERTTLSILDTIGCMLAGSGTEDARAVHRLVARWGGAAESTVLVHGDRVPAYAAVFANASMVHQHDFDDTHDTAVCHPTGAGLTAALAAAELRGGVSGRELVTAVALGVDLASRLALAIEGTLWEFPWLRSQVVGVFGAALAAGKILELDARGLHDALGLALTQAAGTLECLRSDRSAVRGLRDGFAYKDGMLAALLAAEGVRGDEGVFEGEYGFFNAYLRGAYDRERLVGGLGERWEGLNVSLKPWPSCRHTHATLTALFELVGEDGLDASEVEEIVVHVGDGNLKISEPPAERFEGRMALLCNIPFAVAAGATFGGLPLSAFSAEGLAATVPMLARVRTEHDPAQNRHGTIEPGRVRVRFRGGEEREAEADRALGHPDNPMSPQQVADKVRSCAAAAAQPLPSDAVERLLERALALETLTDAGELARLTVA
jgi:2-methylcitrate dehydratase PrpD